MVYVWCIKTPHSKDLFIIKVEVAFYCSFLVPDGLLDSGCPCVVDIVKLYLSLLFFSFFISKRERELTL